MKIRLLTFESCPNATETRKRLTEALKAEGLLPDWEEIEVPDVEAAGRERFFGSPSIQIDGQDVEAACRDQKPSWSCRTYRDVQGDISGAPPVEMIRSAIRRSRGKRHSSGGRRGYGMALYPCLGALVALLPVAVCPLCLPAFLGFLSAIGLGFLLQARFLLPLIVGFLILALTGLAYKAHLRRGYGPLVVGVMASVIILMGKFLLTVEPAIYFGVALLIGASIWNAWPQKSTKIRDACPACAPEGHVPHSQQPGAKEVKS